METTEYYETVVRRNHPEIKDEWVERVIGCVDISIFQPVIPAQAGIQWLSDGVNDTKSAIFYDSGIPFSQE